MAMVKVKSHTRSGNKVSSYTRSSGTSSASKRVGDCSPKGVAKKFKELGYMTKGKTFTGNSALDSIVKSKITQAAAKVVGKYTKNPVITGGIKAIKTVPKVGAYTARGKATYDETCKKIK